MGLFFPPPKISELTRLPWLDLAIATGESTALFMTRYYIYTRLRCGLIFALLPIKWSPLPHHTFAYRSLTFPVNRLEQSKTNSHGPRS